MKYPKTLPVAQQRLLSRIIDILCIEPRVLGIAASGSFATDCMDQFSDLDLVIVIEPHHYQQVMAERFSLIDQIDGKLAAFSGEHVGEPRLVIALYEPDLIHVDFKFVSLDDAAIRVDDTKVLWQRDSRLSDVYASVGYRYPQPDNQWIEDRFWVWLHYGATKIARGEYFEATEFLSFLRTTVLSPLALRQHGLTPSGVRKIEQRIPEFAAQLKHTIATPDRHALIPACRKCVALYLQLRSVEQVRVNSLAQRRTIEYFEQHLAD